jgi:hypothetical protein
MFKFLIGLSLFLAAAGASPRAEDTIIVESADGPDPALVMELEAQLSRDPCLWNIRTMRREYMYGTGPDAEDRGVIHIKIQEAGWDGLPGGIFIKGQSRSDGIDDRSYFVAFATYHVALEELDLWACGNNAGG